MTTNKRTEPYLDKVPGKNPSPIGTQSHPVSDPPEGDANVVKKEVEERRKRMKTESSQWRR